MDELGPGEKMGPYTKIDEIGAGGVKLSVFRHDSGLICFRPEQHYLKDGTWRIGNLFTKSNMKELEEVIARAKAYKELEDDDTETALEKFIVMHGPEALDVLIRKAQSVLEDREKE